MTFNLCNVIYPGSTGTAVAVSKALKNCDDKSCTPTLNKDQEIIEEERISVSIVQTPVHTKSLSRIDKYGPYSMLGSGAANHKMECLDPSLQCENKEDSIHLQFIKGVSLNVDESSLYRETSFILEPHEIISIIHRALPWIQMIQH